MERYKRIRREKRLRRFKFFIILIVFIIMSYGMLVVNDTIKYFDVIENDNLIRLDIENGKIDLLGKSYYIDLETVKSVFK
ncbi:MAG: hypothetical protein RIN55_04990 [Tissierellaceae bacterium]|nr:hypothetical protein [Tissierellaceae bacterium]